MSERQSTHVFVVTATDRQGRRVTRKFEAPSGREALAAAEVAGLVDAVLLSDESMAIGSAAVLNPHGVDVDANFTAEEQLQFGRRTAWGNFLFTTVKLYKQSWWSIAIVVALVVWDAAEGRLSIMTCVVAAAVLLLPPILAAWTNFAGSGAVYDQMVDGLSWGRWEEVLQTTKRLRKQVRDLELDAYEAQALAGLGRLDEALSRLDGYKDDPDIDPWYLCAKYAEVYDIAGKEDELLETHLSAMHDAPETPVVLLDAALAMLRIDRNIEAAGRLVAKVREEPFGGPGAAMLPFLEGLLAYRNGNLRLALEHFRAGQAAARPWESNGLVRAICDEFRAREAAALAQNGEFEAARKRWKESEPRARALRQTRLIREVETALARDPRA